MKPLAFIFITCSLLLSACRTRNEASRELVAYLHEKHGLEVNDSTLYCFFPANQCRNCFLYNAAYMVPEINEHTVIITSFDSSNFKGFSHVLHDSNDALLQLQALDYGNRIISFRNGNISRNEVVKDLYAQLGNVWLELP
jgi:hypothetical protein